MHELHQTTQQSDDGFWISDLAQSALLPEAANVPANFAPAFGFVTTEHPPHWSARYGLRTSRHDELRRYGKKRPIGQARLSQLNGGINPRWLEPHAVASIVYRLRNPRRSS